MRRQFRNKGPFGADTVDAVKSFQRAAGLGVDGVVGPRTWAKLRSTEVIKPLPPGGPGMSITAGTQVGTMGKSGRGANGAVHLHFSMYRGADYYDSINPYPYLKAAQALGGRES